MKVTNEKSHYSQSYGSVNIQNVSRHLILGQESLCLFDRYFCRLAGFGVREWHAAYRVQKPVTFAVLRGGLGDLEGSGICFKDNTAVDICTFKLDKQLN